MQEAGDFPGLGRAVTAAHGLGAQYLLGKEGVEAPDSMTARVCCGADGPFFAFRIGSCSVRPTVVTATCPEMLLSSASFFNRSHCCFLSLCFSGNGHTGDG